MEDIKKILDRKELDKIKPILNGEDFKKNQEKERKKTYIKSIKKIKKEHPTTRKIVITYNIITILKYLILNQNILYIDFIIDFVFLNILIFSFSYLLDLLDFYEI